MYSVMIVDDEKAIRENLPHAVDFEGHGFRVFSVAKNGKDALEKFLQTPVDIVFLDICMPVMDGLGFLKELSIKKELKMPYVIMLSGYSDFEYARTAIRYGVKAYLTKPVDEEEVGQILSELKETLDENARKQVKADIGVWTGKIREMYHSGNGNREPFRGCFVMHCLLLATEEEKENKSCSLRKNIEERIPGGGSAFLRSRGSVYSYLLQPVGLEDYQFSITLFARHFLHWMKQNGYECALLLDESIFKEEEGTFRSDYDNRLYQMETEIFWGSESLIVGRTDAASLSEHRLENEEAYLAELKSAVRELDEEGVRAAYHKLEEAVRESRLNIVFLQEICYRIHYLLMDILTEAGGDNSEFSPFDWRDAETFPRYEIWKEKMWGQISSVFLSIVDLKKNKRTGIGEEALAYVRMHFKEPITLKDVADKYFVTPAYLGRSFQKAAGVSLKQYLNQLRIEEAKRLLLQTDKRIYEIAEEVGFGESKYMVTKFTAQVGCPPAEYRRNETGKGEGKSD